jgi:autophagy-related protein 9
MFSKPNALSIATGRLLVFVSGSLAALLLAFATINDAILLHVKIGQWNLLWYAGVLGASFSIGKSMLPKATNPYSGHFRRNLVNDMNLELEKVATHTHYLPDHWRGKACEDRTKKSFSSMFQYKAAHFATEVASIIVAPLILCVSLPRCADGLCSFVRDSKLEVMGVGDVVGYSTFDFDVFEDENWAENSDSNSDAWDQRRHGNADGKLENGRPRTKHGKMEKSFFNFKVCSSRV